MQIISIHHPLTFEFIPGISYTRFSNAKLIMLTFGTWSLEIVFAHNEIDNDNNNNIIKEQDNGNQS